MNHLLISNHNPHGIVTLVTSREKALKTSNLDTFKTHRFYIYSDFYISYDFLSICILILVGKPWNNGRHCTSNYPGHFPIFSRGQTQSMQTLGLGVPNMRLILLSNLKILHTLGWYMMYRTYAGNTSPSNTRKMTLITRIITKGDS